ncbi:MAG: hypothetical protein H6737_22160 [Alphaproteobacteria bacterium]|nr:hypothetical protein [Alphaproteobacteria bacterium]
MLALLILACGSQPTPPPAPAPEEVEVVPPTCVDVDAHADAQLRAAADALPEDERRESATTPGEIADIDGDGQPEPTRIVNVSGSNFEATHHVYLSNRGCALYAGAVSASPDPAYLTVQDGGVLAFLKGGCAGTEGVLVRHALEDGVLATTGRHMCACVEEGAPAQEERHPLCP